MKNFKTFISALLLVLCLMEPTLAQDVIIDIPSQNIFNRTEFLTVKTVMNSKGSGWIFSNPTFKSTSGDRFSHRIIPGSFLTSSILHWQLESIGGQRPPFGWGSVPGFKWFTTSDQSWYDAFIFNNFPRGNVDFNFKIPAEVFASNAFTAGYYDIRISQNSANNTFTPNSFLVILSVPAAISWIDANNNVYTEINSLNEFRSTASSKKFDLVPITVGNTVSYKLYAKTTSSTIQFTSTKGKSSTRKISIVSLGGNDSRIVTLPLSADYQDHTPTAPFGVVNGNLNSFGLNLNVSASDFRNHFFEAGTYKFQINLNAKTPDNTLAAQQNVDVTLKVLPLSEITIPGTGSNVNFQFNTVAQYQNGQTKTVSNQLNISNNENYELYVKSDSNFFRRSGVQSEVPSSILQVGVEGGSQNVTLSATSKKIVSNGTPVLDKELNIKYTIPAASAQTLVSKAKSTYSIAVVYSFTAL